MKHQVNLITAVRPLDGMRLEVQYLNGPPVTIDCTELAERFDVFEPLRDPEYFREVRVEDWGHSIAWPSEDGLGADRIMEMALEQAGRMDALAFRQWQDRHGLSLAQAAAALDISRRTASQYRTGMRPVPRTVLLALKGWEVETRESIAA